MRHIFSFIVKALLILVTVATQVACDGDSVKNLALFESVGDPDLFESDVQQDIDRKSFDVEVQTSEQLSLTILQPTLFTFLESPIFSFLDAGDLPEGELSSLCQNYDEDSPLVFARSSSTRELGRSYKVGDEFDIVFSNCQLSSGQEVSGSVAVRYETINGLNDTFSPIGTAYCVERLQAEKEGEAYSTLYVVGDEVIISPYGDDIMVEVYSYRYDPVNSERIGELESTHIVSKKQPTLIINERTGIDSTDLTSVGDGDQILLVHKGEEEVQYCQYYERELSLEINNFSVKNGALTSSLTGDVTLTNATRDTNTESFQVIDSDIKVSVSEGESNNEFSIEDFNVHRIINSNLKTYAIGFSGLVSSSAIGGVVSLDSLADDRRFKGDAGDYPDSGYFYIHGTGVELVILQANSESVKISVDYDGDDLKGFSVADYIFSTTWDDLLNRDYQRADYIPEDEI